MDSEVRRMQNEFAEIDAEAFVESWNEELDCDGTYFEFENGDMFIAVINTDIPIRTVVET